jgi:hypothetical protein
VPFEGICWFITHEARKKQLDQRFGVTPGKEFQGESECPIKFYF